MSFFRTSAKILPLNVYYLNNRLYTLYSPNNIIPKGSEILAINKKPVNEIINTIFSCVPSDGDMQTVKQWLIDNKRFSYFYYSFIEQADKFSIKYAEPGNTKKKSIFISATSENKDSVFDVFTFPKDQFYSLKYVNDSIPLLTIKLFMDNGDGKQAYSSFMDSVFKEIKNKGSKNIIIDVRGNPGGQDVYGSLLYSYLTNKDFAYYKKLLTVTDSISFVPYTEAAADSTFNQQFKKCLAKINSHLFRLKDSCHPNLLLQKPHENSFLGNVYILINGGSFSTTCEFCTAVHTNHRGKFIGEETGGNYWGNCS